MAEIQFERLLRDARLNAALAWVITAAVALMAVEGFLTGDIRWGGFALALVIAVELHTFTGVRTTPFFAVAFVAVWGTAHLTDALGYIANQPEARASD